MHTPDGGNNWVKQATVLLDCPQTINFVDENKSWIACDGMIVLRTIAGGN